MEHQVFPSVCQCLSLCSLCVLPVMHLLRFLQSSGCRVSLLRFCSSQPRLGDNGAAGRLVTVSTPSPSTAPSFVTARTMAWPSNQPSPNPRITPIDTKPSRTVVMRAELQVSCSSRVASNVAARSPSQQGAPRPGSGTSRATGQKKKIAEAPSVPRHPSGRFTAHSVGGPREGLSF